MSHGNKTIVLAFAELFGDDFAEFLDPNFNTTKYEVAELGNKPNDVPTEQIKTSAETR
jgi:hypothetical protein